MFKAIYNKFTIINKNPTINNVCRNYDQIARFRKPLNAKAQQDAQQAGIRTDHPAIFDPTKPNPDGTLPIKAQLTHGPGKPSNPSQPLHSTQDATGQNKPQNAVIPTQPMNIDPNHLQPPIKGSDNYCDQKEVKDNMHKAGAKPSEYKNGDPYP